MRIRVSGFIFLASRGAPRDLKSIPNKYHGSPASLGDPPRAVDVLLVVGNDKMAEDRDLVQVLRTLYQMISVKGCLQIHVLGQSLCRPDDPHPRHQRNEAPV